MDSASSTPAGEQVRPHIVNGGKPLNEPSQANKIEHSESAAASNKTNTSSGNASAKPNKSLTLTKNGIVQFTFTDESIGYIRPDHRPATDVNPNLMGTPANVWNAMLTTNSTVRDACRHTGMTEASQKMQKLRLLQKERLMKDLQDAGYHADGTIIELLIGGKYGYTYYDAEYI